METLSLIERETTYCEDVTLIYKFNAIPIKISASFVAVVDKLSLESMQEQKFMSQPDIKKEQSGKTSTTRLQDLLQSYRSHHIMANKWGNSGNSVRLYFSRLQNHCRW